MKYSVEVRYLFPKREEDRVQVPGWTIYNGPKHLENGMDDTTNNLFYSGQPVEHIPSLLPLLINNIRRLVSCSSHKRHVLSNKDCSSGAKGPKECTH